MSPPRRNRSPLRRLAALAPTLLSCLCFITTNKLARGFPIVFVRHGASPPRRHTRPAFFVSARSSALASSARHDGGGGGSEGGKKNEEENLPTSVLRRQRRQQRRTLEVGTKLAVPSSSSSSANGTISYLGCGSNAVVRLGCVLVAPEHETRHFLRRAAIFVYAMGERPVGDNVGGDVGSDESEYVIRGLILDQPTAFALSEMMPGIDPSHGMADLPIFRGGDTGQDGLILLRGKTEGSGSDGDSDSDSDETTTTATEITSGLYHGGWNEALAAGSQYGALDSGSRRKFKVFFNYCEFTEAQLEAMLASSTGIATSDSASNDDDENDDDDAWVSLEVPPDAVLNSEYGPGEAWANFRNAVAQMRQATAGGGQART